MNANRTLQVSCVQLHWAKSLEQNLERTLHYVRLAADEGSRVVLFPEANLTGYYFPDVVAQDPEAVERAFERTCRAAAEAGLYQEEMITAVLDLDRVDRSYALDSLQAPPFLRSPWQAMIKDVQARAVRKPE